MAADVTPVMPCYLGWSNPGTGPASTRLYACDRQPPTAPRWDGEHGRVVEQALAERFGGDREGDRYLVARVGNRFVDDERLATLTAAIEALAADV